MAPALRGDSPDDDGVVGTTNAAAKSGVFGFTPVGTGLRGVTQSSANFGVFGSNDSSAAPTGGGAGGAGVFGLTNSPGAAGVFGSNNTSAGVGVQGIGPDAAVSGFSPKGTGLRGVTQSSGNFGVFGSNDSSSSPTGGGAGGAGVFGLTHSPGGAGVFGSNQSDKGVGVFGICKTTLTPRDAPGGPMDLHIGAGTWGDNQGGGYGVRGTSIGPGGTVGVHGHGALAGVEGFGSDHGIFGLSTGSGVGVLGAGIKAGVEGQAGGPSLGQTGVLARSGGLGGTDPVTTAALKSEENALKAGGRGLLAIGVNVGGQAIATTGHGLDGLSITGVGVAGGTGGTTSDAIGVFGVSGGGASFAGKFQGNVDVKGNLTKNGGGFRIDHPLAPTEKYLNHSFVESSDRKNVYDGIVVLNDEGRAAVELPAWFEALNIEFRYQLTCIGDFAPVYVERKLSNNRFTIAGGTARMEISWQVTGIRSDRWAQANALVLEEEKDELERGRFRDEPHAESRDTARTSVQLTLQTTAVCASA